MKPVLADPTPAPVTKVQTALLTRQGGRVFGSAVEIVTGLAMTVAMGALVAGCAAEMFEGLRVTWLASWSLWAGVYVAVLIPLLFRHVRRRGEEVEPTMVILSDYSAFGFGGDHRWIGKDRVNLGALLLLWGPARVIDAIARLFADRHALAPSTMEAAVAIVVEIGRHDSAQPLAEVLRAANIEPARAGRAIGWLMDQGHLSLSKDRRRAWIDSRLRERLR
jgi:hypothetical protein